MDKSFLGNNKVENKDYKSQIYPITPKGIFLNKLLKHTIYFSTDSCHPERLAKDPADRF